MRWKLYLEGLFGLGLIANLTEFAFCGTMLMFSEMTILIGALLLGFRLAKELE